MGLKVKQGTEFEDPKPGRWLATCIQVVDLGTQQDLFKGKITHKRKVRLGFELLDHDPMEDGRPFTVYRRYTASLGKKANLRRDLESWRGKPFTDKELEGFDVEVLLGKSCELVLVKSQTDRVNITNIIPLKKGARLKKPVNQMISFDLDEFDQEVFNSLSDGTRKVIMDSAEFKLMAANEGAQEDPPEHSADEEPADPENDDMPF